MVQARIAAFARVDFRANIWTRRGEHGLSREKASHNSILWLLNGRIGQCVLSDAHVLKTDLVPEQDTHEGGRSLTIDCTVEAGSCHSGVAFARWQTGGEGDAAWQLAIPAQ